jgi:hypothetical protein
MAFFDSATQQIVVRIVYDGLGGAGKTSNVRALRRLYAHASRGEVVTPDVTSSGRTLFFDWLLLDAGYVETWPLRCEVISVPGQFAYSARRYHLLQSPDAVVEVCDSRSSALTRGRLGLEYLRGALHELGLGDTPIVLQANKRDSPDAVTIPALRASLNVPDGIPVVAATAHAGDGVQETFIRALALARNRVRQRIRQGGEPGLAAAELGPSELLEQMRSALLDSADANVLESVLPPQAEADLQAAAKVPST